MTPVVWGLALVWVVGFVVELQLSDRRLAELHDLLALDAREWWHAVDVLIGRARGHWGGALLDATLPLVGYKLLHGGAVQVLSNAVAVVMFGGRLEARIGSLRFLAFHELAGAVAAFCQLALMPEGRGMAIGASAAVSASIVAYLLLYRRSRVLLVVPVVVLPVLVEVPALVVALAWVVFQIRPIARLLEIGPGVPIAWPAYAGGVVAGALLLPILLRRGGGGRR